MSPPWTTITISSPFTPRELETFLDAAGRNSVDWDEPLSTRIQVLAGFEDDQVTQRYRVDIVAETEEDR